VNDDFPYCMRAEHVARFLDIGINKARRLLSQGVLPAVKLDREYRIYRPVLEQWLRDNSGQAFSVNPMTPARRRALRAQDQASA
jgi:excisionase family DNA binding protein